MTSAPTASRFRFLVGGASMASLILASLLPAAAVHAEDGKVYPAVLCQPLYFGAQPQRTPYAIYPAASGISQFVCPGIRDEVYSTHGLNSAVVTYNKQAAQSVTCYIYSFAQSGAYSYLYKTDSANVAGVRKMVFGSIAGYPSGHYAVVCNMPAGSSMISYNLNEYS